MTIMVMVLILVNTDVHMQLTAPSAVNIAVATDAMICAINLTTSLFFIKHSF